MSKLGGGNRDDGPCPRQTAKTLCHKTFSLDLKVSPAALVDAAQLLVFDALVFKSQPQISGQFSGSKTPKIMKTPTHVEKNALFLVMPNFGTERCVLFTELAEHQGF